MVAPTEGREAGTGRFTAGNKFGRGNKLAAEVHNLRRAMFAAVTPEDVQAAMKALVAEGRAGNVVAIKELLDRLVGKPIELDYQERLEQLEEFLERAKAAAEG